MAKNNMTTLGEYGGLLYKLNRDRPKLANREERRRVYLFCATIIALVAFALWNIFFA